MIITDLINVYKAGKELANPAGWKKGQILFNAVNALVTAVLLALNYFFPNIIFPAEVVEAVVNILYFLLIAVNWFLINATTKKDLKSSSLPTSVEVSK